MTVEVETRGARRVVPSTLIVGVLADLSGQPEPALPALSERAFLQIDRDNFDDILARSKPRLAFEVEDLMRADGSRMAVALRFARIEDFEPAQVVRQIGPMRRLLEFRGRLAELERNAGSREQVAAVLEELRREFGASAAAAPGSAGGRTAPAGDARRDHESPPTEQAGPGDTGVLEAILGLSPGSLPKARAPTEAAAEPMLAEFLNDALSGVRMVSKDTLQLVADGLRHSDVVLGKQLSRVLHHPSFQRLEATWRGLYDLVFRSETCENLEIRALNVGKRELTDDFQAAGAFDQSTLFRKLDRAVEKQEPFGVLIGDFEFSNESADLDALEIISQIAAAVRAPFLAAAAPEFFGLGDFAELDDAPLLAERFRSTTYDRWRRFRSLEASRYLGLCVPRVLLRLPYGRDTHAAELLEFEEDLRESGRSGYLWGNAALVLGRSIAAAYTRAEAWRDFERSGTGGSVSRLPVHVVRTDDEPAIVGPCAIALSERRAAELAGLGFIPLVSIRNTDEAYFPAVVSSHQPQALFGIEVEAG
jgi:type VI secretion system protein ImpC